jgi:hypothetical protein
MGRGVRGLRTSRMSVEGPGGGGCAGTGRGGRVVCERGRGRPPLRRLPRAPRSVLPGLCLALRAARAAAVLAATGVTARQAARAQARGHSACDAHAHAWLRACLLACIGHDGRRRRGAGSALQSAGGAAAEAASAAAAAAAAAAARLHADARPPQAAAPESPGVVKPMPAARGGGARVPGEGGGRNDLTPDSTDVDQSDARC